MSPRYWATLTPASRTNRDQLLPDSNIVDPTPRGTPGLTYVVVSKRDRLKRALAEQQRRDGRANRVLLFIRKAMSPVRFRAEPERFETMRG